MCKSFVFLYFQCNQSVCFLYTTDAWLSASKKSAAELGGFRRIRAQPNDHDRLHYSLNKLTKEWIDWFVDW